MSGAAIETKNNSNKEVGKAWRRRQTDDCEDKAIRLTRFVVGLHAKHEEEGGDRGWKCHSGARCRTPLLEKGGGGRREGRDTARFIEVKAIVQVLYSVHQIVLVCEGQLEEGAKK